MADYIRPTPRNPFLGGLADLLEASTSPERTQQMQGIMSMLGVPAVASTLNRMSYGAPLTSGAGGLGGTTRVLPDVLDAALAVAPMAPAAGKAAVATGKALGPTAAGMTERYMQRQGLMPSLDVYHGTPHKFAPTTRNPLGEFDASKIGTGEGAQVYGHGLYFAENPTVAKGYADKLAATGQSGPWWEDMVRQRIAKGESIDDAKKFVAQNNPSLADKIVSIPNKLLAVNKSLYKADLPDAMIAKMLDWDKPMSEKQMIDIYDKMQQSSLASFAKPFQDNFYERMNRGQATTDGQDLFMELSKYLGGQKQVSDFLRSIDIPGIKYLDEGSRAKGEGTRNFVTFPGEEQNLRILERNGLLGTLAP